MNKRLIGLLTIALAICASSAHATIININAKLNGDPRNSTTDNPFPVQIAVTAGVYQATLTNPSLLSGALYTAWNHNGAPVNWRTDWSVLRQDSSASSGWTGVFGSAGAFGNSAQEAFDNTLIKTATFTLLTDATLGFIIVDNVTSDNLGGISLDLQKVSALPTPASALLLLMGLLTVSLQRRLRLE